MGEAAELAHPRVSIIIKALNEERRIERCLEAAVREARQVDGEVILVDSLSKDRTVALASQYQGVRIVQFLHREDTGCGAAVQLGYQFARGEFIYVLDADMVLQAGFLAICLERMRNDQGLAGVGGKLIDTQVKTLADRRRVTQAATLVSDAYVGELGGGGLYRRQAIESVGYLSDRNLKAYEEADLGARLRSRGWKLLRIAEPAVSHEGHSESNGQMLVRLWRNGRAAATGTFIKSSLFRPWFRLVVRKLAHVYSVPAMHVVQFLVLLLAPEGLAPAFWGTYWTILVLVLATRKASLSQALWSLALWHYLAVASVAGFFSRTGDPKSEISAKVVKDDAALSPPVSA